MKSGEVSNKQFPIYYIMGGYSTKTLQGVKFRTFRYTILNVKDNQMIYCQLFTGVCWVKDEKLDSGGVKRYAEVGLLGELKGSRNNIYLVLEICETCKENMHKTMERHIYARNAV